MRLFVPWFLAPLLDMRLLTLICAIGVGSLAAQQPKGATASQRRASVSVPFIGCRSGGQAGPQEAPLDTSMSVAISPTAAHELAYYSDSSGPGYGVLGPRGWHCFGTYGSGGGTLFVSPQPVDEGNIFSSSWDGFLGPAIEVNYHNGDGSGMVGVAEVIARVFPAYRWFATGVMEDFDLRLSFGPYPKDTLTYRSKAVVEYRTPAQIDGLGTHSSLKKNDSPIEGVAFLSGQTYDLVLLSVRLPSDLTRLTSAIVRQLERDAARTSQPESARRDRK